MVKIDNSLRYDGSQLMSYNRLLNFVNGARGLGKTFFFKKFIVKRFIEKSEQFIWLRRNKSDLKKIKNFFDDLKSEGFLEGVETKVLGRELYVNKKLCGWAIPLTSWQSEKSTAYPNVKTIIYDEFLLEKSNVTYIPNEVESFLNLLDTVIRTRDDVRVFCLSNSTTIVNPYYLYFNLVPDTNKRFNKFENIVIEIPENKDFAHEREKTAFGRLIRSTDYANMSIDNKFTQDSYTFVEPKTDISKLQYLLLIDEKTTYGIWYDDVLRTYYVSNKFNNNVRLKLTNNIQLVEPDVTYFKHHADHIGIYTLSDNFKKGNVCFENITIRKIMYDLFKKIKVF